LGICAFVVVTNREYLLKWAGFSLDNAEFGWSNHKELFVRLGFSPNKLHRAFDKATSLDTETIRWHLCLCGG
jgi:hypothetical protein